MNTCTRMYLIPFDISDSLSSVYHIKKILPCIAARKTQHLIWPYPLYVSMGGNAKECLLNSN